MRERDSFKNNSENEHVGNDFSDKGHSLRVLSLALALPSTIIGIALVIFYGHQKNWYSLSFAIALFVTFITIAIMRVLKLAARKPRADKPDHQ